jgi:uncharacterized LabA/DUF88 family protein
LALNKNDRRIALFLDFENLITNTGLSATNFELQPALDRLLEKGKVVFRRAYCDWSRFREGSRTLHDLGVELIDVPPSTRAGKNGADMRLVIDALELCYAREHIDTFVIASGDSDFCPLAYKLRENGRTVIGLAAKESTSPLFVKACDEFIYLKPAPRRGSEEKDKRGAKPARGERAESGKAEPAAKQDKGERGGGKSRQDLPRYVRQVVQSLLARATEPLNPSVIKDALVRREPDFDPRDYGFSTFSKLLGALEREGLLKLQQLKGQQWYALPPDSAPEPKGSDASSEDMEEVLDEEEVYPDPEE